MWFLSHMKDTVNQNLKITARELFREDYVTFHGKSVGEYPSMQISNPVTTVSIYFSIFSFFFLGFSRFYILYFPVMFPYPITRESRGEDDPKLRQDTRR